MRIRLGLALCMLAGCATQPPAPAASATDVLQPIAALDGFSAGQALCLGVEYLPPSHQEDASRLPQAVRIGEPVERAVVDRRRASDRPLPRRAPGELHAWAMSSADLVGPEPATEELALRFLDDLLGEDRRRLRRESRAPMLAGQTIDMQSPAIDLRSEEAFAEDQQERLSRGGLGLLRRPVQKLLRRMPIVTGFEVRLEQLTHPSGNNEPVDTESESMDMGRLTLRVRPSRSGDPLEIGYRRSGFFVATSQQQWKSSFSVPITDSVSFEVRSRQDYDVRQLGLRATLRWDYSSATTVQLAVGNDIEAFSPQTVVNNTDPAPQGSDGIMIYAIHFF